MDTALSAANSSGYGLPGWIGMVFVALVGAYIALRTLRK